MLKTNIAKPASSMIIIGMLKGYINNIILFFIKTILTFKGFKKTIEKEVM